MFDRLFETEFGEMVAAVAELDDHYSASSFPSFFGFPHVSMFSLAHLILVKCLFYLATRDLEQKSVSAREKCFYGCGV
jgi:hypothetical protein